MCSKKACRRVRNRLLCVGQERRSQSVWKLNLENAVRAISIAPNHLDVSPKREGRVRSRTKLQRERRPNVRALPDEDPNAGRNVLLARKVRVAAKKVAAGTNRNLPVAFLKDRRERSRLLLKRRMHPPAREDLFSQWNLSTTRMNIKNSWFQSQKKALSI